MSPEKENNQEQGKLGLSDLLNNLTDRARSKIEKLFGPVQETEIPQGELDELIKNEQGLSHSEIAKRIFKLRQKYPNQELPDEFKHFLDKE